MRPVVVGGKLVTVSLVEAEDDPELESRDAYFDNHSVKIVIDNDLSQEARWHVFTHEVCHAGNWHLQVEFNLTRLGLTSEQAVAVEEYMAECFATHVDTLERNGWIKRPIIK